MHVGRRIAVSQAARWRLSPRILSTALIAALTGFLIAALLFVGWRDYESSQIKAEIRAKGAARVLESELRRLVTAVDLALRHIVATGGTAPEQLERMVGLLPAHATLSLFTADGAVSFSMEGPNAAATQTDGAIFDALRSGTADLYIGALEPNGGGRFVVARALRNGGKFRGIILAAMPADAIGNLVDSIDIGGPDSVLAAYGRDGSLVFRRPRVGGVFASEKIRGSRALQEYADKSEGVYRSRSVVDGVDRIIAFRRLPDLGLMVVAGPSVDYSLADTRARLTRLAWFAAPTVMLFGLIILAMRSMTREALARVEARDANRAKMHFISGTYHDLGQILLALDLFLSRLRETATDDQLAAVEGSDAAVRSAHDLLDTMMDTSQLASGGVRVFVSKIHVRNVLDRIAVEVEPRAAQKGLRLSVRGTDLIALSDPHLLERIIRNLVVNAIKFTSVGGVLIACRRVGDEISIEIWDSGPGIPEAEHKAIFTAFHRMGRPLPAGGMGLGLSIVERFATLLGHPISLRSRMGRGSVFKLRLKQAADG